MKKYWRHFKTITIHKWYVMLACFKCGLIKQGLLHDLSKYSIIEFASSARYFQGNSSPIGAMKRAEGYSLAWQNHKAKNKHHWQYWTDFENGKLTALLMPVEYLSEMISDWVGAGKAYNKGKWTIDIFKSWYAGHKDEMILHSETRKCIDDIVKYADSEKKLYSLAKPRNLKWWYVEDQVYGLHNGKPDVFEIGQQL